MKKTALLLTGHLCLMLGIAGAILPLLPTTPFLLLAAFFYSKSSERLHRWILEHKYFGPPLRDWENRGVIGIKAKLLATVMLGAVMIFRLPYLEVALAIRLASIGTLLCVLIFIWSRPSHTP